MPTVLQQLCVLPFSYFSNPKLTHILFPTLIACCHDNRTNLSMLEQEASGSLLSSYIKVKMLVLYTCICMSCVFLHSCGVSVMRDLFVPCFRLVPTSYNSRSLIDMCVTVKFIGLREGCRETLAGLVRRLQAISIL